LQARLDRAPADHAEALLAAYEVLQGLHDSGALDLLRGALGSRDKVLDVAAGAAASPTAIRLIRNALTLVNLLGSIEPDELKRLTQCAPDGLTRMIRQPERPGLWALIKDFLWNPDFRRGMAGVNMMLEALGRSLSNRGPRENDSAVSR
jgi:uncharacterized protein YjgD (DUF1641 family)